MEYFADGQVSAEGVRLLRSLGFVPPRFFNPGFVLSDQSNMAAAQATERMAARRDERAEIDVTIPMRYGPVLMMW